MKGRRGGKGILGLPERPVLPIGEHWVQREVVEGNRGRQGAHPVRSKGEWCVRITRLSPALQQESHMETVIQRRGEGGKRSVSSKAG